jgi:hypothetical protein
MLAPNHVFHMLCVAITQLACYRYPTLWTKASEELEISNQALLEMTKRYPTAFGAQRVVRDVERAVKKQERYNGALHLGLSPDQVQYFKSLGPELCSKWDFVQHMQEPGTAENSMENPHRERHDTGTSSQTVHSGDDPSTSLLIPFHDANQIPMSMSMAPSTWDAAVGPLDFTGMMEAAIHGGGVGNASGLPFDTVGNWMLSDWMTDLGW